jgi:hypothetical protein
MFTLIITPIILGISLLLIVIKPLFYIFRISGFWVVLLYFLLIIVLQFIYDLKGDEVIKDYLGLGLNSANEYAYFGLYVCVSIGCVIFIYKLIKWVRGFLM